jgi:hypothetical protein
MPLVFNAFGPLKQDLALATRVLDLLLPGFIGEVTDLLFEHAPARGHAAFTGDATAFDVLIRGKTHKGKRALVAVELKYSEELHEPAPRIDPRYGEIAAMSGLFTEPTAPALRRNPLQQPFRLHCLAQCLLTRDVAEQGVFLFITPALNRPVQRAVEAYASHLAEPTPAQVPFVPLTLELLFEAIAAAGAHELGRQLWRRYLDFWLVDGEIALALQAAPPRSAHQSNTEAAPATGNVTGLEGRRRATQTGRLARPKASSTRATTA